MTFTLKIAYLSLLLGVLAGVFSFIRVGAIIIAFAMTLVILAGQKSAPNRGMIPTYLPILIAISLFAMAIALPRGL